MEINRYNELMADTSVIKLSDWETKHFYNQETDCYLHFTFFHKGVSHVWQDKDWRVRFELYPASVYQGNKNVTSLNREALFLTNSNFPDYAILYKSTIDVTTKTAKLEIIEYPLAGLSIITQEEQEGILAESSIHI